MASNQSEYPVYDSAQNYLNRLMSDAALELLLGIADTTDMSSDIGVKTRIAIAEAYRSKREYEKGFANLYEVLSEKSISDYNKAHAYNRLAALYNESKPKAKNHFDSVIKYSQKCVEIAEANDFFDLLASSKNEIGFVFNQKGKYKLAEEYLVSSRELYLKLSHNQHAVGVSVNLAGNYLARKMYDKANATIDSAFNYVPKEGNENLWMRLYLQKAKINEYSGNWKAAYYALSYGRITQKMYYNNKLDKTVSEMIAKYELDKQQLKLKEEERRSKARLRNIFMLSVILIITIILFAISYRSSALKLKNKTQKEALQNLEKQRLEDHLSFKQKELSGAIANAVAYNQVMNSVKSAVLKNENKAALQIINSNIDTHKNWREFLLDFNQIHPDFFSKLRDTHPNLTKAEQKLSAMLLMGLKSKEIAGVLNIALSSVNKARNRLRKKIALDSDKNFVNYFKQFIS
ncbi:MAG: LuxR C-terminal-related transcriptional regulator [Bacteroidota bacterium]|nr:LuxR C-terminal-related transcriptional regulator [Bacteroidota bacterium]